MFTVFFTLMCGLLYIFRLEIAHMVSNMAAGNFSLIHNAAGLQTQGIGWEASWKM